MHSAPICQAGSPVSGWAGRLPLFPCLQDTNETDRKLQAACTHVLGVVIKHALIQPFRSVEVPAGEEARKR